MALVKYRMALDSDVPGMARIRSASWGTASYWNDRILAYLHGNLHPKDALASRVIFVAEVEHSVVGLAAGHLTRRFGCQGELEWLDVELAHRRKGIATGLLRQLAAWFEREGGYKVCVDVDPANVVARQFYRSRGAAELNEHWFWWKDIRRLLKSPSE
jgi:GNAT superfamily N-acetyltransferase